MRKKGGEQKHPLYQACEMSVDKLFLEGGKCNSRTNKRGENQKRKTGKESVNVQGMAKKDYTSRIRK